MGTLAAAIAVREGDDHELVTVLVSVERRAVHLVTVHLLRGLQDAGELFDFPQKLRLVERLAVLDDALQLGYLLRLLDSQLAHEVQVFFHFVLHMAVDVRARTLMLTSGEFERTGFQYGGTIVCYVTIHLFSRYLPYSTTVWTTQREMSAIPKMFLKLGVSNLFPAVLTKRQSFGTLLGHVRRDFFVRHQRTADAREQFARVSGLGRILRGANIDYLTAVVRSLPQWRGMDTRKAIMGVVRQFGYWFLLDGFFDDFVVFKEIM